MGKNNKRSRPLDNSFGSTSTTTNIDAIIERVMPLITDRILEAVQNIFQPLVQDLRDRVKKLEEALIAKSQDDSEEKERRRAIVISGLREEGPKPSNRRENDIKAVNDIIDELGVDASAVQVFRMGKSSISSNVKGNGNLLLRARPPLLKVIFQTSAQQRAIIINSRNMKESARFKGVFLRPSLTSEQRDAEFNLREELRSRRASGEKVGLRGWPGEPDRRMESRKFAWLFSFFTSAWLVDGRNFMSYVPFASYYE